MEFETGLFKEFLIRFINSGLSAIVVYKLFSQPFMDKIVAGIEGASESTTFSPSAVKRFFVIGAATLLSVGAYALTGAFGWSAFPETVVGWIDLVIWLGGLAFAGSQAFHAKDL